MKLMNKLTKEERQEIRDSIKGNLEHDFIENYDIWKASLDEVNDLIRKEVKKSLILSPMYDDLLYTYDELCINSLSVIDSLPLTEEKIDPQTVSKEITRNIAHTKLCDILKVYIDAYEKY